MSVVTVGEAKTHLKLQGSGSQDSELAPYIAAAERKIAARVGYLELTTLTVTVPAGTDPSGLIPRPVLSVESATDSTGAPVEFTLTQGIVAFTAYQGLAVTLAYRTGFEVCPPDLKLAVLDLVKHLWQGSNRSPAARDDSPAPGAAHDLPYRVAEAIGPYELPGFA